MQLSILSIIFFLEIINSILYVVLALLLEKGTIEFLTFSGASYQIFVYIYLTLILSAIEVSERLTL